MEAVGRKKVNNPYEPSEVILGPKALEHVGTAALSVVDEHHSPLSQGGGFGCLVPAHGHPPAEGLQQQQTETTCRSHALGSGDVLKVRELQQRQAEGF